MTIFEYKFSALFTLCQAHLWQIQFIGKNIVENTAGAELKAV